MYLRDIAVASWQITPTDPLRRTFNLSTHVVVESVLARIPRNSVDLDGLAKLNVAVADPTECQYEKVEIDAVGTYYVHHFDFEHHFTLCEAEQQDVILTLLNNAFDYIAHLSGSNASVCLNAIEQVRKLGLPLPRLGSEAFWQSMPENRRRSRRFREQVSHYARLLSD